MTPNKNNASIIRKDLLIRLYRELLNNDTANVDRIPIIIKPRGREPWRCCVYKDRAVLKYKIMSMLGYSEADEKDELTPLSWYAEHPKGTNSFYLNLIEEACSNCPPPSYVVTNLCRGCEARPCQFNCPKDAVSFQNGQAVINAESCINCGKCMRECPYNAIHYQPRPCEDVCPVDAIYQNPKGYEEIDMEKCILCGRCLQSCPFGAVIPSSDFPVVLDEMKSEIPVVAIVAPAVAGQFRTSLEKIYAAIRNVGFDEVYEVAEGAEKTASLECAELLHLQTQKEHPGLMSSCCPAWVNFVKGNKKEWNAHISETPSPMVLSAQSVKEKIPNAKVVFIGPCLAKKEEAHYSAEVDYAITFEELGALFVAAGIEVANQEADSMPEKTPEIGRGFSASGGVAHAIEKVAGQKINAHIVNGIDKISIRQMAKAVKDKKTDFFEVMCCEEGCLGGSQSLTSANEARRIIKN
ncbi:Iron hydrogenase 1 [Salinivirga cyanobacteriivorans]|uniref:Iron hydrogenase 1 n=1 Tax=Salinivirga cyanobacteriivorans TaxID=1307839 RepID=A0A0S2I2D7_9BACT|nr:monomeric [FeFe] hydrogenase [Salinivirga cyanobacteriivorans]ALO16188.1 Iron hydrogenase 1 [Salinivirga cyanobacteriivorans]